MLKKINISLIIILSLCSLTLQAKSFKIDFAKKVINLPKKKIEGPGFWMFKNVNFNGFYPTYGDSCSGSVGSGYFNFGQAPFKGDPKGYKAYDPNYNSSLWVNGVFNGKYITPPNVESTYYKKSYTSGKYYFEVTLSTSCADEVGIGGPNTGAFAHRDNTYGISYVGNFSNIEYKDENGNYNTIVWDNSNITTGDTLQVYLDYDDGNILIKKLGTTENDYVNVLH